jgi:hypothetical protein
LNLEAIEWAEASDELEELEHHWDAIAGRLQKSKNKLEREHVCLGTHAEYGYPVLVHKPLLNSHVYVVGDSGSYKTFRVLTPLTAKLIRDPNSSVVIMDMKGEKSQLESARLEAERAGKIFKVFTNVLGLPTHVFNSLQQLNSKTTSVSQFVETMMEALRLAHGDGYGTRFFSVQTRHWLSETVKRWPNLSSFEELYSKCAPEFFKNDAAMDRCREAIAVLQQLAEIAALNWKPKAGESDEPLRDAIFMPDVVAQGQVIYFWLPAAKETSTVKEIGNLGLYCYFNAVKDCHERGGTKQAYLVMDEFQQIASEGFKMILRQARSSGLSLILASQSEADLMTKQSNRLLEVVRSNTQVKIYLTVSDLNTLKMLEKVSGLIAYAGPTGMLDYRPRLTVNDIRRYSSHSDYAICWITRDSGFTAYGGDWFGLRTSFHITEQEFKRRDSAPWPAATESTIIAERTLEGPLTFSQNTGVASKPEESGREFGLKVPEDSIWAKRLMDVFSRRASERRNEDAL